MKRNKDGVARNPREKKENGGPQLGGYRIQQPRATAHQHASLLEGRHVIEFDSQDHQPPILETMPES